MTTSMTDDVVELRSGGRRIAPGWVAWVLIVLATIIGMGATLGSWVDRQALDTDEWVSVSDDMLADDDVRGAVSQFRELLGAYVLGAVPAQEAAGLLAHLDGCAACRADRHDPAIERFRPHRSGARQRTVPDVVDHREPNRPHRVRESGER